MNLSSTREISLQFLNTASGKIGARYDASGSLQFFLSKSPEEMYNDYQTDIVDLVGSVLRQDTDIVGFSEIFGIRQKQIVTEVLMSKGYTVYAVDAFEMWSQSISGEHLYNVVGIKEDRVGSPEVKNNPFHNKRPFSGIAISVYYLLSSGKGEGDRSPLSQAIYLNNRLLNGILDGAISVFQLPDFTLATGHVHKFNSEVRRILGDSMVKDKPFILVGDMNVPHGKNILLHPPFNTPNFKSLIHPEHRTFGFVEGLNLRDRFTLATAHMQPDVLIASGVNPVDIRLIQSMSDHDGIHAVLGLE